MDLRRVIRERWGVVFHERTIGKVLPRLGFAKLLVRPKHPQTDPVAQAEWTSFGQHLQAALPESAQGKPLEVWFAE